MKTPSGCWKSFALAVVVGSLALAYLLWRVDRVMRPPPVQIVTVNDVSHLTGLILPPGTILLEGARWRNYFLVARLRFSRADLTQFLAQGAIKADLDPSQDGSIDIFHDSCEIETGEEQLLDHWKLKRIKHSLTGECDLYPSPPPPAPARSGGLSLSLDLDDPRTVYLFVKWDARGGFAC